MKENRNDDIFRQIAGQYTEKFGEALLEENEQLTRVCADAEMAGEDAAAEEMIRNLDHKVYSGVTKRRRGMVQMIVAAAACLVFVMVIPFAGRFIQKDFYDTGNHMEESTAKSEELPDAMGDAAEALPPAAMPIAFQLPENLTVKQVKEDNGMTIYQLSDCYQDDVVLQMEEDRGELPDQSLTAIELDGSIVYGTSQDRYQKICFSSSGVTYTLTCRYDINTLTSLCKNILNGL